MVRFLLLSILLTIAARVVWRMIDGAIEGYTGEPRAPGTSNVPAKGVPMVRDPVCGTFVLPSRAVSLVEGRRDVYFCSENCRDKYRARTA
jgi:YHS domain-containing protein